MLKNVRSLIKEKKINLIKKKCLRNMLKTTNNYNKECNKIKMKWRDALYSQTYLVFKAQTYEEFKGYNKQYEDMKKQIKRSTLCNIDTFMENTENEIRQMIRELNKL